MVVDLIRVSLIALARNVDLRVLEGWNSGIVDRVVALRFVDLEIGGKQGLGLGGMPRNSLASRAAGAVETTEVTETD